MKLSNLDYQMFLNQKLPIGIIDSENGEVIATNGKELKNFIESEVRNNVSQTFFSAVEFVLYSSDKINTVYCRVIYDNSIIAQFMAYSFLQANTEFIVNSIDEAIQPILKQTISDFEQKESEEAEIEYYSEIKGGGNPSGYYYPKF